MGAGRSTLISDLRCLISSGWVSVHGVRTPPARVARTSDTSLTTLDRVRPARRRRKAGRSTHKNYCAKRRRNTPKQDKPRGTCAYCADKRAGKHWKERSHKPCARIPGFCIAKKYKPKGHGASRHALRCLPAACAARARALALRMFASGGVQRSRARSRSARAASHLRPCANKPNH